MYQKHSVAVVYQELAAENQYEYAPLPSATASIVDIGVVIAMSHNVCLCKQLWPAGLTILSNLRTIRGAGTLCRNLMSLQL